MYKYKRNRFRDHCKKHLVLAYPIMISQLSHISIVVADNIMISWLGTIPLAAGALANSVMWPFFSLGIGVSYGMTSLVAAANARGNYRKVAQVFKHALLINFATSLLLCSLLMLGTPLLHHMGQTPAVALLSEPYLWITTLSLIPLMIFQTFREYTEGLSFTKEAMYINVACSLINVLLNYLLIYGKLGIPPMGLNGAGWATLISRIIMALMMGSYVFSSAKLRNRITGFNFKGLIPAYFIKIIQIGLPTGLEFTLESIAYTLSMIMVGWMGAETQAAHMIAVNLDAISLIVVWGIALATTIRVGNQFGLRNFSTLRSVGFIGYMMGGVFMLLTSLVFLLSSEVLPSLYTAEVSVLNIAAPLVIILGIFQVPNGAGAIGVSALRGIEDTSMPFFITIITYCLLGIPLSYLLCFQCSWGVQGVWWGLGLGKVCAACIMLYRFHQKSNKLLAVKER